MKFERSGYAKAMTFIRMIPRKKNDSDEQHKLTFCPCVQDSTPSCRILLAGSRMTKGFAAQAKKARSRYSAGLAFVLSASFVIDSTSRSVN